MSLNENTYQKNNDYESCKQIIDALKTAVGNVVAGASEQTELLIMTLISGGHALIEDVPGTGKTTLAASLAKVCGLTFNRAQFTPDVTASDITGFNIYNRSTESFEFRPGLVMCNILLADEINRASPKTQSSLLEAMEEGHVTVDGVTYQIPHPFTVIATQNPVGFVGTYPLPEAQLDRFSIKISLGYPTEEEEVGLLADRRVGNPLDEVKPLVNAMQLSEMQKAAADTTVDDALYRYIVALVSATRRCPQLELGASPRAALILSRVAQARAFVRGRGYVVPEDIAAVFLPVIAHRLIIRQDSRRSGVGVEGILLDILKSTPVPEVFKRRRGIFG